jgi:DNA/RNA-binding domain of Phe-tRNA-synthetase-like protein
MKIAITRDVLTRFPGAEVHGLVAEGLLSFDCGIIDGWRQRATDHIVASGIRPELLSLDPAIKVWRDAYQKFGLKPSKFRSSIEQLYKRALKGDLIRTPIDLVNLYCYISVINKVPAGAYDLGAIQGSVAVRLSSEGEPFQAIGEQFEIPAQANVVCYTDECGIICYGWNYRDAQRTCLGAGTDRAIFFVDTVDAGMAASGGRAIDNLKTALESGGARVVDEFRLSAADSEHGTA